MFADDPLKLEHVNNDNGFICKSITNGFTNKSIICKCGSNINLCMIEPILIEHYAGKWPFWLSPRQISVVPIAPQYNDYADKVRQIYHDQNFFVDVDLGPEKFQRKIRNAQLEQYNFVFVVGEKRKV